MVSATLTAPSLVASYIYENIADLNNLDAIEALLLALDSSWASLVSAGESLPLTFESFTRHFTETPIQGVDL